MSDVAWTTGEVISEDGTTIGYRRVGVGPPVVLLHGAMSSGYHHRDLAEALADAFEVFVPDRRGRGLSGPYAERSFVDQEVEDLEAILAHSGATDVFGLSSGAIITLLTATRTSAIAKAVLFEPPFLVDTEVPRGLIERFEREIAEGKVAAAMVTGMKASRLGPRVFDYVPRFMLEALTERMLAYEDKSRPGEYVTMRAIAPTLRADFEVVLEGGGDLARFRAVRCDALLLGGGKSQTFLKRALDAIEPVLPKVRRVNLPGLGHGASWNRDRRGDPAPVAAELRRFWPGG